MLSVGLAIGLVVVAMVLMIGINILGNFDGSINCSSINSTKGQTTCTDAKNNIWLAQSILPYGLIIAAIGTFVGGRLFGF